jgi:hypothetical protein
LNIGQEEDDKAMQEARRQWKKAHPGIAGEINLMILKSYAAGFDEGMKRGEEKRGCCHVCVGTMDRLAHDA